MQRKESILYRATKENEDSITEILCNLMRDKYLRDILLVNLGVNQKHLNTIKFDDISTQVYFKQIGKPDICIENSNVLIFIENKVKNDTDLQDTQVESYLEKLESSRKETQMIYLVPREYKHLSFIHEVCDQNTFSKFIYWDDFLKNVAKYEISESNLVFKDCFRFFEDKLLSKRSIIKFKPEEIMIMYNPRDLMAANGYFIRLRQIITNAEATILSELNKLSNDFSPSYWSMEDENEKGKYINYKGEQKIFYGLNFNLVPNHQEFLFAVDVMTDILDSERLETLKNNSDVFIDDDWTYKKIDKYFLIDDNGSDTFAKSVIENIKFLLL
jgi:hypothetical protein